MQKAIISVYETGKVNPLDHPEAIERLSELLGSTGLEVYVKSESYLSMSGRDYDVQVVVE